jgi:hypothetical protein
MTVCTILNELGNMIAIGEAMCSYSDNFNYKRGRDIALGRALAYLEKKEDE